MMTTVKATGPKAGDELVPHQLSFDTIATGRSSYARQAMRHSPALSAHGTLKVREGVGLRGAKEVRRA